MQIFFLFYSAVIIRDGGAEIKKQQNWLTNTAWNINEKCRFKNFLILENLYRPNTKKETK
jgi:hypothetical protein